MKFKLIMGCLATLSLAVAGTAHAQEDAEREAIAERLKPVGELCLEGEDCGTAAAPASASADSGGAVDGAGIYNNVCMACHESGAAGAPVRGQADAWASRLDKGIETLYDHAINGFQAMPAKGGNPNLSDDEVKAAVNHLVEPVYDGELPQVGGGGASEQAAASGGEGEGGEGEAAAASDIDGEAVYGRVCMACHDTGAAGAPMLGDAEAWAPRLEKGTETLYDHAINGVGAMPPKGGNPNLSDAETKAAVDHMIEAAE